MTGAFEPDELRRGRCVMQGCHLAAIDEGIGAACQQHQRFADSTDAVNRPDIVSPEAEAHWHLCQ